MSITRHFLGWDAPLTRKVCDYLLPGQFDGPADLSRLLIVVPTRQAGRSLREALARRCAEQGTALLSARVVTPRFFLQPDGAGAGATPATVLAAWIGVLLHTDLAPLQGLFPQSPATRDFPWALQTAGLLQRVRDALADGGRSIQDVASDATLDLEEPLRWKDLATLEAEYLRQLRTHGLEDPCAAMIRYAAEIPLPADTQRLVLAAVPDPTPLMVRALQRLALGLPVDILVHAPPDCAEFFDEWGRPLPERWKDLPIGIPDAHANVRLAANPPSQSEMVLDILQTQQEFGPADVAIGVPDQEVSPFLVDALASRGLPAFDPAGKPLAAHPLCQLLDAFGALLRDGTSLAFSTLLRHPDFLAMVCAEHRLSPSAVLQEWDQFQNDHLPASFADISERTADERAAGQEDAAPSSALAAAAGLAAAWLALFDKLPFEDAVRSLLQSAYARRALDPRDFADQEFAAAAESLDPLLIELGAPALGAFKVDARGAFDLLLDRLKTERYYLEPHDAVVDLEGWLELPWNDAPLLILTGMNEGAVPDSRIADVFLPDSLRARLHLRHDEDRLARDAFVMRALVESRRASGRVCFIAGKASSAGDPLKPSRLLFRCPDADLVERATRLFGDPAEQRTNLPATISFRLDPSPPRDVKIDRSSMSVTAFRAYLACPFRFYLANILGMETVNDEKTELDPTDFGSLVHTALQRMAQDKRLRNSDDAAALRAFLAAQVEALAGERYGRPLPLQVLIQVEAAKQRLGAAAEQQARLVRDGWEILRAEVSLHAAFDGMTLRGRVDRIDRHRETGALRVLDYKSTDRPDTPAKSHLGTLREGTPPYAQVVVDGKPRRWIDLQLPLYRILLRGQLDGAGDVQVGYFNMPKAITSTGIEPWPDFTQALEDSAAACARGVLAAIRSRVFWPPAERVAYDDFERLFHAAYESCIDLDAFGESLRQRKGAAEPGGGAL